MTVFIFKTDLKTPEIVNQIRPVMNAIPAVNSWFVDTADVDNVMRIETNGQLTEIDMVGLIKTCGFFCEPLLD